MSTIKANKHQIGSNATLSKNIVLDTDTSTGDLVISKGVHDGVLTELYRFPNSGFGNYVDDAAAASGGVPVGALYRNGSVVMVRVA